MEASGEAAHQVQPLAVAPLSPKGGFEQLRGKEVVDAAFVNVFVDDVIHVALAAAAAAHTVAATASSAVFFLEATLGSVIS